MRSFVVAVAVLAAPLAAADEGMWTFDQFPSEQVKQAYGFAPDAAWLEKVRLSSARIGEGCSSSFVSADGLLMTNHHCVRGCIELLSTPAQDLISKGFVAKTRAEEKRCPKVDVSVLEDIQDVTARVNAATKGRSGAEFNRALKAEMATLEAECGKGTAVRCEVVTLFNGGRYDLYRYARYDDVRLAFAPELEAQMFGGYADNFDFPRYSIDMALLRVYRDGKPIQPKHHFAWSKDGSREDELVFVPGHPGGTERKLTVAQLEFQRDVEVPRTLVTYSELRGQMMLLGKSSPAAAREVVSMLRGIENGQEVMVGRLEALANPKFMAERRAAEQQLREKIRKEFDDWQTYDRAFDEMAAALEKYRGFYVEYKLVEPGYSTGGELLQAARQLTRLAEEKPKPNAERLREFTDARLPRLQHSLLSPRPFRMKLEKLQLEYWLQRMLDTLGPDHPQVKAALGKKSPQQVSTELLAKTRLIDPRVREQLFNGGKAAIDASKDPLILFARAIDPLGRQLRKRYEDEVESVTKRSGELVGRAHLIAYGMKGYPDATGTLRLSYGKVSGWKEGDQQIPAFTQLAGTYERNLGYDPFRLTPPWVKAKSKLDLSTPFNLVTTNDIIGGNSGSPLINQNAEIVGLVFDGNVPSLAGRYYYDPVDNRTVAVDSRGMLEVMDKVYGAKRLRDELQPATGKQSAAPSQGTKTAP